MAALPDAGASEMAAPEIRYVLELLKTMVPTVMGESTVIVCGALIASFRLATAPGTRGIPSCQLAGLIQLLSPLVCQRELAGVKRNLDGSRTVLRRRTSSTAPTIQSVGVL